MKRSNLLNIETDPLRALYNEIRESLITEQEAVKTDITHIVWKSIETRIKAKEAVNLQIRGGPTEGKSTVGAQMLLRINRDYLGIPKEALKLLNKKIFSDQIEFIRWIKQGEQQICIQIDEWNSMVATGYNATTEMTLFDYYSDVFAQRYVHRISCSPSEVVDRNCYLFLDIEGRDLEKKTTRCKVTYVNIVNRDRRVLGHMDIDVSEVMKQDWYQAYRRKKFKRMELLEKHGQRDIRELEFEKMALKAFDMLKESAISEKHDADMIKTAVEMAAEEEGRIYSIITVMNISSKTKNLTMLRWKLARLAKKIPKAKSEDERIELKVAQRELSKIQESLLIKMHEHANLYDRWINIGDENGNNKTADSN